MTEFKEVEVISTPPDTPYDILTIPILDLRRMLRQNPHQRL